MFSYPDLIPDRVQRVNLLSDFRYIMVEDRLRDVQWKNEKQWMQITARHKEQVLCLKGSQSGEWVTQRACKIFILDDIHNVTGKDPEQLDITSKLPPVKSRWPPLGLFYWRYFVVPWFRFLNGILNFSRYLHLALIQHWTPLVCRIVHHAVLVHGPCVQGHLMEKA